MKKYMFGLIAVALAIGFSAFTRDPSSSKSTDEGTWYEYTGTTPQTSTSRKQASNYSLAGTIPTCVSGSDECAVQLDQAPDTHPDFSGVSFDQDGFPVVDQSIVLDNRKRD